MCKDKIGFEDIWVFINIILQLSRINYIIGNNIVLIALIILLLIELLYLVIRIRYIIKSRIKKNRELLDIDINKYNL